MTTSNGSRGRPAEAPKLWGWAGWLCLLAIAGVHFVSITRGTGALFGRELLGFAYDSLADALLAGSSTVAPRAIKWEAFEVGGRTHMYFGPFPALLRIVPDRLFPALYGHWSMASCYLASLLSLWAFARIAQRSLEQNPVLPTAAKRILLYASLLGFGLGTPLAFLMSSGSLYHESILWGLCCSSWGVYFALRLLDDRADRVALLAALSTAAAAALLSRVTFGLPLLLVTGALTGARAIASFRRTPRPAPALLGIFAAGLGPAALGLGFQLWYNADRFGSIATFIDFRYLGYLVNDADSWSTLERTGNFNAARLPTALVAYFGVSPRAFASCFPFLRMVPPAHLAPDLYPAMFAPLGRVVSLSVASPWILFGALAGSVALCEGRTGRLAKLCGFALLSQLVLVMSYYVIEQRYAADFLPYLVFAHAFFLRGVGRGALGAGAWIARAAPGALAALALLSFAATASATLSWIPESGPFQLRSVKERVAGLNRSLGPCAQRITGETPSAAGR